MPDMTKQTPNTHPHAKKKASLGRGLGSLLGGNGLSDSTPQAAEPVARHEVTVNTQTIQTPPAQVISEEAQIWMIPIDRLVANTQQPRQTFTPEALKDLTASISAKGILQPITARRLGERQFEIIAGERRWRAAQAAGLHEVPVILKKVSEQDSLEYAIIENIQREDLNPMEEAEAYQHLLSDYSQTQQQVADKLGKERSTVANSLRLLALQPEVKIMVRKNELSAGHAKVLLGVESGEAQIALAKQITAEKLSVRATEKLATKLRKQTTGEKTSTGATHLDVNVSQRLMDGLSSELQKLVGSKVSIDYANSKGKLLIHFYSDEQLTQIVEKIRRSWEK